MGAGNIFPSDFFLPMKTIIALVDFSDVTQQVNDKQQLAVMFGENR